MGFFSKSFGKSKNQIKTYEEFWNWFTENEQKFYQVVKKQKDIEVGFFNKLSPKLDELKEGFYFLSGMFDSNTVELVITPDGVIENIVFVEELVNAAPKLPNWKFTALKPAIEVDDIQLRMNGYNYDCKNIFFYANEDENYPDEIEIVIVYKDFNKKDESNNIQGVYIFIDNYLGELNTVTLIDNMTVIGTKEASKELIPIHKLKSYLIYREKEFVEKYKGVRYNEDNDKYASLQGNLENGLPMIATVNQSLLEWKRKASHPWILKIDIAYDGKKNNGFPNTDTLQQLESFEDAIMAELKYPDGYLNIGRQTGNNERTIYFACKDFRKPAKVAYELKMKYANKLNLTYAIYKDKYWQSFEMFRPHNEE